MDAVNQYGDFFRFPIGFWEVYVVTRPDFVQHIFLDNWRNYSRDTFQYKQFSRVTGQGLLTTSGDFWQQHRRLAQPAFHRRQLEGMTAGILRAIERMAGRWREQLGKDKRVVIDIDQELLRLALEIIGESLFSLDLTTQALDLSQEMLDLMHYVVYRSQNLLAPPEWLPTKRNRTFRTQMKRLNHFLEDIIQKRRQNKLGDDLVGLLLAADPEGIYLSDKEVRDELVTMIIAGYETVATGLGWVFKLLVEHPATAVRLRHELLNIESTFDGLMKPSFMNQVINEAFRLYPPSWLLTRRSIAADRLGEYEIPAGSLMVISPYAVQRSAANWPEPDAFRPERFADESSLHRFANIPFGGGPHLCIGKPLAMLEASATLAILLPQFDFQLPENEPLPGVDASVTLRPHPALKLVIEDRS
jgi:cytochrome P450